MQLFRGLQFLAMPDTATPRCCDSGRGQANAMKDNSQLSGGGKWRLPRRALERNRGSRGLDPHSHVFIFARAGKGFQPRNCLFRPGNWSRKPLSQVGVRRNSKRTDLKAESPINAGIRCNSTSDAWKANRAPSRGVDYRRRFKGKIAMPRKVLIAVDIMPQ